jgi:sugar O-acyltransferase (sialic acid O-acetyltransferase NeuD family)
MKILIIGAGGHGQVVADILLRMKEQEAPVDLIGFLDDNAELHNRFILNTPVLGSVNHLSDIPHDSLIVAVGDNHRRKTIFNDLLSRGEKMTIARHPRAVLSPDIAIGDGTMICAGVIINPAANIGCNVILNTGCTIDHHNEIGDHVHIAPGAHLGGDVHVGAGSLVGIGATVMPGRCIGEDCIIGAGALVQKDIPDGSMAIGVPARVVKETVINHTKPRRRVH